MVLASPSRFLTSCLMYEPFFCGLEVRQERKGLNKCFRKPKKRWLASLSFSARLMAKVPKYLLFLPTSRSVNLLMVCLFKKTDENWKIA